MTAADVARRLRTELDRGRTWMPRLDLKLGRFQMRTLEKAVSAAAGLRPTRARVTDLDLALYERRQPGTPVVFLHGFGGDKETWLLMAPFLRRRPLLIVDLPGHGASTAIGRDRASAAAMGRVVVGLLDQRQHAQVHLCGNSMGGGIALWIARHHPERVASLVLVASAAPELVESEMTRALARGDNLLTPGAKDADRFIKLVAEKPPRVPAPVKRYVAARRAAAQPRLQEIFRGWVEATGADRIPHDLEAIRQPALIIHGEKDRVIAPDTARKVLSRLPNSQLHMLPGIGHVPQLEAPALVAKLVARHLAALLP